MNECKFEIALTTYIEKRLKILKKHQSMMSTHWEIGTLKNILDVIKLARFDDYY